MSAELTGRVEALEDEVLALTQGQLQRPTSLQVDALYQIQAQKYEQALSDIRQLSDNFQQLLAMYYNLRDQVTQNYAAFTGHTGATAVTGHYGGLTGELL